MNEKNKNDILLSRLGGVLKLYLGLLCLMFVFRIAFYGYFGDSGILAKYTSDVLLAFWWGLKYDTLVLSYLGLPVILAVILTSIFGSVLLSNLVGLFSRFYFLLGISFIVFISLCDLGFYNYFQDRINILFFGVLEDDTSALVESLVKNYQGQLAFTLSLFFIFLFFCYWFLKKIFPKHLKKGSTYTNGVLKYLIVSGVFLTLLFGGMRGGYSELVIAPKYSEFSENEFINLVALNGMVTLEKAIKLRRVTNDSQFNLAEKFGYGKNIQKAFSDYLGIDILSEPEEGLTQLLYRKTGKKNIDQYHVVVFLMESFGGHWIRYNSEKFNFLGNLNKHFEEDLFFPYSVSADNGTIGSLITLATNIPNRPGLRFLSESRYMRLKLESSLQLPFQRQGYKSSFYYGGKLGWRDIGKYLRYQGWDELYGENSLKNQLNLQGRVGTEWGVYDEHLFNGIYQKLESSSGPQFILALSTTNHPPFETPQAYKKASLAIPSELKERVSREKETFLSRFNAFEYSNQQLAKFLTKVKESPLAEKTIVVVTGDHNFWGFMNYDKSESFSKHTVPLYFYIPKSIKPKKVNTLKVTSHKDIGVTLYELLLSEQSYLSFGTNLFSEAPSYAFNTNVYASKNGVYYKEKPYKWNDIPLIKEGKSSEEFHELQKQYRSTLSVADYFLKESFKKAKSTD